MSSFGLELDRFASKTKGKADLLVRKVVFDVSRALVEKSPVGDASYWQRPPPAGYVGGRFRANWQYGVASPNRETSQNIDASGEGTIGSIVGKVGSDAAGKVHYITNSLHYAKRLEDGYSRQAPQGMVRLTVLEFRPIVSAVAASLRNE